MEENLFLDALDKEVREELVDLFGEHVPSLKRGWDDAIGARVTEALREPSLLDVFMYRKVFPARQRISPRSDLRDMILATPAEQRRESFNHYARGLISMYHAAVKLGVPTDKVVSGPKAMLGYKFVNHQGLLEFGLTLTTNDAFPDYVVEAATALLNSRYDDIVAGGWDNAANGVDLNDYEHVRASFPRGKNSGLPWMVSGSNRLINNLVLSVNAGLAAALIRGYPLKRMFEGMLLGYVVFSRFQRTGKEVPLTLDGVEMTSVGIEGRRRIINSTPKVLALACKPLVKWLTLVHLQYPEFQQDRDALVQRIRRAGEVIATDASRFDLRSGGVKLRQGLDVIVATVKHAFSDVPPAVYDLLYEEAFLPTMVTVDTENGPIARWSSKSALRSGASTTSRVGSIINLMYDMFATAEALKTTDPAVIVQYYREHSPSVIQGDDMLKLFPGTSDRDGYVEALPELQRIGMTVEIERPTKFLGYLTTLHGDEKGKMGLYHSSNPLDNMFFPERFRDYAVASMLSRYVILKTWDASEVVRILTRIASDAKFAHDWYTRFYNDMMPILRPFYETHPIGAAKAYFRTLLAPSDFSLDKLAKAIKHDEDELLRHIAQTARFEMNERMFGEDDMAEDDDGVVATLLELRDLARADGTNLVQGRSGFVGLENRWADKDPRVIPILRLFDVVDDEAFVQRWRDLLPQVSREIHTEYGNFFVANL